MQVILKSLYKAYFEARKNKRFTKEQPLFEKNYEHSLHVLYELISELFLISPKLTQPDPLYT